MDSTLSFATRRNAPVRYNRDLVATTLRAMQRVSEIRARRERVFYKNRMAGNKERERALNRKIVAENQHLLPKLRSTKAAAKQKADAMEIDPNSLVELTKQQQRSKAPKARLTSRGRLLVGGGIEEEDDQIADDDDDDDDDDDEDLEMDSS